MRIANAESNMGDCNTLFRYPLCRMGVSLCGSPRESNSKFTRVCPDRVFDSLQFLYPVPPACDRYREDDDLRHQPGNQEGRVVSFLDRFAENFGQHMPHEQHTYVYLQNKKVSYLPCCNNQGQGTF